SGGPFNGAYISNCILNQPGPVAGGNGAVFFSPSGTAPHCDVGNIAQLVLVNDLTLECWFHPTTDTFDGIIIASTPVAGGSHPYELAFVSQGVGVGVLPQFTQTSSNGNTITVNPVGAPTMAVGSWHHLAVVRRGLSVVFWIDGVPYP